MGGERRANGDAICSLVDRLECPRHTSILLSFMRILLCSLLLLAALGPVLTFARLFQIKEWRADRLREHMRREGWLRQFFGWARPTIIALGLLLFFLLPLVSKESPIEPGTLLGATWGLLAWFTLFRFVISKQSRPIFTKKALIVVSLALALVVLTGFLLLPFQEEPWGAVILFLLPLFSSISVVAAILFLHPLDRTLKRRILARARAARERYPHLTVIGITGSVGKTTTKELLAHLLSNRKVLVTPAYVNTELGVADLMIRKLTDEHELFIVEMGAYRRGEIARLCSLVAPHIGVITFVSDQHLALFGSKEDLCRAKGELFAALPPQGYAFLNADSLFCSDLSARAACPVQTVGTGGHATYEAYDSEESASGISFTLQSIRFHLPIHGTHQVSNVLLAIAVAALLGVPLEESAKRLSSFHGLPQTFEKKVGKQGQVVLDDTHNASSASFRAAIEWARIFGAERKILVTAGLIELGSAERAVCQELGYQARDVFHEVIFLDKKCAQYFEQGFGRPVLVPRKKAFKLPPLSEGTLTVCEGRIPESLLERFLS